MTTLFKGPQGGFAGLDQTNVGSLDCRLGWFAGGPRAVVLSVDGDESNVRYGVDFEDADGDLGPLVMVFQIIDNRRLCQGSLRLGPGPQTGQNSGRVMFRQRKGIGLALTSIQSFSFSVQDAAGHVSNRVTFELDPPGSLSGWPENCSVNIPFE